MEFISTFLNDYGQLFLTGTWETIVMTFVATLFAYIIGTPIGIFLILCAPGGLKANKIIYNICTWIVSIGRSIPFVILLVALLPVTRFLVGTSLGVKGAIVPLIVTSAPFAARMIEQSLAEIDKGVVEAAQSSGAGTFQIVWRVYLKESLPSIIRGVSITFITLFGYSAMAGVVGAGGLGDIAIRYGYQRFQTDVMVVSVVLCILLVIIFQMIGDIIARKIDKRNI